MPTDPLLDLAARARTLGPLLAPPERDALLHDLCATARAAFGAAACSVALVDTEANDLAYVASDGSGAREIVGVHLPLTRGVAGFAVSSGQTLAIDDVRTDARFAADVAERTGYVPTTILAAPISRSDRALGVLSVLDRTLAGADALTLASRFAALGESILAYAATFADFGSALLAAVAAVSDDHDITDRLLSPAPSPDPSVTELAGAFAALADLGDAERATATRLLVDFASYARARRRR